ncbi:MAG: hypothetical protein O2782_12760 [bacterium]|nr:hypothetical protein [bacterium]
MFQAWNGQEPSAEFLATSVQQRHRALISGSDKWQWQQRHRTLGTPLA